MKTFLRKNWIPLLALAVVVVAWGLGALPPLAGPLMVGAISFGAVPSNLRVPFVAVEFSNAGANQGSALLPYRVLIIGQRLAAGTAAANTLQRVTSADQVATLAGRGSMLHRMAKLFFLNNTTTETWIGLLDDNAAGVAASGTITATGPATGAGTLSLYLGGTLVQVGVAVGDTANAIAANIAATINAILDLPITAAVAANAVTVTYRHKGLVGNDFDMRVNYQDGEKLPAGVGVAFVPMAGGTANPLLANLVAAMGDSWFQVIAHPCTDAGSLTALEQELASRFGPMRMIDGLAITSAAGTQATLATLGESRNSQSSCIVPQPGKNPLTPPCEFAAGAAAVVAYYGAIDPARPLQTLSIAGVLPPAEADRFTLTERNLNLFDGVSATRVGAGGDVQIDRIVTTYQQNAAGAPDASYLDATTMLTLMYARYSFRSRILTKYPRHKLAADGTRFGAGQAVVTPKVMRAECIAWFRDLEEMGLLQNFDAFKSNLVVERNAQDPNRLDVLLPPGLVNQLVVTAASLQFQL